LIFTKIKKLKNHDAFAASCGVDSLQSSDAVSLPDFPPDFGHASSLLNAHHDDGQLPCKHHDGLKDVCPDDGLQPTLSGADETHREYI